MSDSGSSEHGSEGGAPLLSHSDLQLQRLASRRLRSDGALSASVTSNMQKRPPASFKPTPSLATPQRNSPPESSSTALVPAMDSLALNEDYSLDHDAHPDYIFIKNACQQSLRRLQGLQQGLLRHPGIPEELRDMMHLDLQAFSWSVSSISQRSDEVWDDLKELASAKDRVSRENDSLRHENERLHSEVERLYEGSHGDLATQLERSKQQVAGLQRDNAKLHADKHELVETLEATRAMDQATISLLRDQVNAKRTLWLSNPGRDQNEKKRALALTARDDPISPPTSSTLLSGTGISSSFESSSSYAAAPRNTSAQYAHYAAPQPQPPVPVPAFGSSGAQQMHMRSSSRTTPQHMTMRQRPSLNNSGPRSGAKNSEGARYDFSNRPSAPAPPPTLGSPTPRRLNSALIPTSFDFSGKGATAAQATKAQGWFMELFDAVKAWADQYIDKRDSTELAPIIAQSAPKLWSYMTETLYPDNAHHGAAHAAQLLKDRVNRPHFAIRLVLQYVVQSILSAEGWEDFSPEMDQQLKTSTERLNNMPDEKMGTVFKTVDRQREISLQSQCIMAIVNSPRWDNYRQFRINFHTQRLKTIMGPLIDPNVNKSEAGEELFGLATHAMEVSANMFQSLCTYQFIWNQTCSKFAKESHLPLNSDMEPVTLQLKQWRIMLVVTPGIIMRDERGLNISPYSITKSEVLVMN